MLKIMPLALDQDTMEEKFLPGQVADSAVLIHQTSIFSPSSESFIISNISVPELLKEIYGLQR